MYLDADQFVTDWLVALRGGEYPQAMGKLHTPEGFCCLGVACDLFDKSEWFPCANYYVYRDPDTQQKNEDSLPYSIMQLLDLTHDDDGENPQELPIPMHIARRHALDFIEEGVRKNAGTVYITTLNDAGCPFPVIADIIEDWWKERKETA